MARVNLTKKCATHESIHIRLMLTHGRFVLCIRNAALYVLAAFQHSPSPHAVFNKHRVRALWQTTSAIAERAKDNKAHARPCWAHCRLIPVFETITNGSYHVILYRLRGMTITYTAFRWSFDRYRPFRQWQHWNAYEGPHDSADCVSAGV